MARTQICPPCFLEQPPDQASLVYFARSVVGPSSMREAA